MRKNSFLEFSTVRMFEFIKFTYFYFEHKSDIKHLQNETGLGTKTI